mgnify:CR=1 FL=1
MKLAIITGASRGIGRETAKTFAKEGYSLLLNCEKNIALLEELKTEIEEETKVSKAERKVVLATVEETLQKFDNSKEKDSSENNFKNNFDQSPEIILKQESFSSAFLEGYFHAKETERVEIDELVLILNQGKSVLRLTQEYSADETDSLLQANLLEPFQLVQRMIPYLLRAKEGRILFSSSVWGNVGASMESLYSLTKGGINSFVKALGKELAPSHIAVNAVAFGAVDTDMNAWLTEEERSSLEEEIPYGRMATVEEAADFLLLLSKAPLYLTAQVIPFDGGWI